MSRYIDIAPEIERAVRDSRGVVSLETAVLTQGLPSVACSLPLPPHDLDGVPLPWDDQQPVHLQVLSLIKQTVTDHGCVPAITAVINGKVHFGLTDEQLNTLGKTDHAGKVAITDLALAMAKRQTAGTTVSGTLAAMTMASEELGCGLEIMATGGIGGVHRGWTQRPDISADLTALSRFSGCVVCAGPKSILDVEATREILETLGVPVIGYQTDCLPRFLAIGTHAAPVTQRVETIDEITEAYRLHRTVVPGSGSVLVANEPPEATRLNPNDLESLCQEAESVTASDTGPARTPTLLAQLHGSTGGRSLTANISVLVANAELAARIAASVSRVN